MRIQFTVVGTVERHPNVWVEMDSVPQVGDGISLPSIPEADTFVRTVVWYPLGDPDDSGTEGPFVYVVLGQHRSS